MFSTTALKMNIAIPEFGCLQNLNLTKEKLIFLFSLIIIVFWTIVNSSQEITTTWNSIVVWKPLIVFAIRQPDVDLTILLDRRNCLQQDQNS